MARPADDARQRFQHDAEIPARDRHCADPDLGPIPGTASARDDGGVPGYRRRRHRLGLQTLDQRPRPSETEPNVRVLSIHEAHLSVPHHVAKGRSFTSGHACNNVALAMVGCAIFGRGAWWLWLWALLVSYSRIYVGAHYPSDILGSWLVSLIYSFLILKAAEWLWQRHAPRKWPNLYAAHPVLFPPWARVLRVAQSPGAVA